MRRLRVVGIGPGGPDHLTVEAVAALRDVDVFLVPDKGIPDLVALRAEILARHTEGRAPLVEVPDPPRDRTPPDYEKAVADWHEARVETYERALLDHVADDGVAGMLVWGDPSLYDSTLRIVDRINARGVVPLAHDVVPGVSSVSLLAARHRIALHRVGEPVTITTGRRLPDAVTAGADNLVVVLDGALACGALAGSDWDLWWGANLGTPDEEVVAGRLGDVLVDVRAARERARAARGWVMDVYLLRRVAQAGRTWATTQ